MAKYLVGAGRSRRAGWKTIDANPRHRPDIVSSLPPVPRECQGAEAFELIHVFEHFYLWDAQRLLREFHAALAPGGELIIECPNLRSAIDALSGKSGKPHRQWGYWVLYGDPRHRDPLYGHRWGWMPETLEAELRASGFETVRHERAKHHVPDRDFRIVAVR